MADAIVAQPEQLQGFLALFLSRYKPEERVDAVRTILEGDAGRLWREHLGNWATWLVPVDQLVPEAYKQWRPLVRDAMWFTVSQLAADRLAPKIVEQSEAPPDMPAEMRMLRLISRVPGLQKIGQVLARNRHFDPRFRRALAQLENGISDAGIEDIRAIIFRELGPRIEQYRVKVAGTIFSEASVSAVVRFTWRNPETGRREGGVFKVLKPHIPACYAEDMKIIQNLARFLGRKYVEDREQFAGLAETLTEIALLLEHEVDFRREQRMLVTVGRFYSSLPGVRVPRLIEPLSTASITALSHEAGVKVTKALRRQKKPRARLAQTLAETLLAVPVLTRRESAFFHGDPHAGNLLYDSRRGELVILDWALTERLSRDQRRFVALLLLMTVLRDPDGICDAIERLRRHRTADDAEQARTIRECVTSFVRAMPLWHLPGAMDALQLLDKVAKAGIRFPAQLVMFRKAAFTLDGVVEDVAGTTVRMDSVLKRYALTHWFASGLTLWTLLSVGDWLALEWSALTYASRLAAQAALRPWLWLRRAGTQAIAAEPTSG